ncbi:MAG TPA: class I SAM-dependent methyltransferase [Roseiflexaceae bacterium]|nr:class I SAM-dependent methyltransferase [Roseiflexaceae bacterium]
MLTSIVDMVMDRSPAVRRKLIRFWYQLLTRIDTQAAVLFMNYGYADLGTATLPTAPGVDASQRHCAQLYHHVAGAVDLKGHDVLEVGCGRGGGAAYIKRCLAPRSLTGVDFSDRAIRFCARYHHDTGVAFVPGDAEALPFGASSFDAVVNIESSHCYSSMARFVGEVYRVLRPGGYFLYADFRPHSAVDGLRRDLTQAGFAVRRELNITPNIVLALDQDSDRKLELIRRYGPRLLRARLARFAAVRGTSMYEGFRTGQLDYRSYVLQKPVD